MVTDWAASPPHYALRLKCEARGFGRVFVRSLATGLLGYLLVFAFVSVTTGYGLEFGILFGAACLVNLSFAILGACMRRPRRAHAVQFLPDRIYRIVLHGLVCGVGSGAGVSLVLGLSVPGLMTQIWFLEQLAGTLATGLVALLFVAFSIRLQGY